MNFKPLCLLMLIPFILLTRSYVQEFRKISPAIYAVTADKVVPAFSAKNLQGEGVLSKDLKGPALFVFWQVACPACKPAMLLLNQINERIRKEKKTVKIVTIAPNRAEDVMGYYAKNKIDFQYTIIDELGSSQRLFGANVTPLIYVIDKKYFVRGIIPGASTLSKENYWQLIEFLDKN